MKTSLRLPFAIVTALILLGGIPSGKSIAQPAAATTGESEAFILEGYPEHVARSIEKYTVTLDGLAAQGLGQLANAETKGVIVKAYNRWLTGKKVRVAFFGGTRTLQEKIEGAALAWVRTGGADLDLSFRDDTNPSRFRTWSPGDTNYAADIRISFSQTGYWSLIGRQSRTAKVIGGRPNQPSMSLSGFDRKLPANWETIVVHEFGHALGFAHEHQSPAAACEFRFDDDKDYVPTQKEGVFITDRAGKRPGLYTYLGGAPNNWDPPRVDANLKTITASTADQYEVTEYDKLSVMEYFFPVEMFVKGKDSPCYIEHANAELSDGDKRVVAKAYGPSSIGTMRKSLEILSRAPSLPSDIQSNLKGRLDLLAKLDR